MRFCFLLMLWGSFADASYRAYRLRIRHFDAFGKPTKVEMATSSLDPYQYEHYHGGYRWTKVELVDTWYCPGDTSRNAFCRKPKTKDRFLASGEEKRAPIPYSRQPVIP